MFQTLDKQFDYLPKEVKFCRNCVVSNQRPLTDLNEQGVCSACVWAYEKDNVVNWAERERELQELCNQHRSKDGSYDVIVPGSGGKDSAYVAHQLKYKYKMNPLCITWAPFDWTNIGWKNLKGFVGTGYTNLIGQPNGQIHRRLAKLAFELKGDAFEPFVYGQRAYGFHIAKQFGIKLIFFGENGSLEYGGMTKFKNRSHEGPEEWELQYFKGANIDDLLRIGHERGLFTKEETKEPVIKWYKAPPPDDIIKLGLQMHWFSYYKKWVPQENFYYATKYTAFDCNPEGRSEGTYTKYASLDDMTDGFHFYLSYIKFGLGRASRDAQQDIRRHHLTRDEGVALVKRYDGEFPKRHFQYFLNYLDISESFFWEVMDYYRSKSNVWQKEYGKWKMNHVVQPL